jgi:HEAT repeat protein
MSAHSCIGGDIKMKPLWLAALTLFAFPMASVFAQKDDDELLKRLASGDRQAAAMVIKQGETIFPALAKLLATQPRDDYQSLIVYAAAEIARDIGPKAKAAVPTLAMLMKSQDKAVASDSARALGYIGADATPAVIKALRACENEEQAIYPVRALRNIGPPAKESASAILDVLKKTANPHFRVACVDALGAIGPGGKDTVEELLKLGKDRKAQHVVHVIVALGSQGSDAKAAIPFLVEVMKDAPEPHLRVHALDALARISPSSKDLSDAVARMLDQPHVPKIMILESLAKGGAVSKEMLKSIEEMLRDKDVAVRLHAAMIVGKANRDHAAVVSILIESLSHRDAKTRRQAAETIGVVRPTDEAVIEALQNRAKDADPAVRQAVADALAKFKKK